MVKIDRIGIKQIHTYESKDLDEIYNTLIDGLKLMRKISDLMKYIAIIHSDIGKPITKSVLLTICKLAEVLKCCQNILHNKNRMPLVYCDLLIAQNIAHKALTLLNNIKKNIVQVKSYNTEQLDVLSALSICENCLKGGNSDIRNLVANLCLSYSKLSNESLSELRALMKRLELCSNMDEFIEDICNCSFLYWYQTYLIPVYFSKLIQSGPDMKNYYLLLDALKDSEKYAKIDIDQSLRLDLIEEHFLTPLNQQIETKLRYNVHSHLEQSGDALVDRNIPENFSSFMPTLINSQYLDLKRETEHYLSKTFYNLIAVCLHDWKSYGEMRKLATLQHKLDPIEDYLPTQTLEQGLDVLEIMRNINVFVERYMYNMNGQFFVEEASNSKHFNTITLPHVANSIRTHGIGIMNTTVNYSYQFLQKKFFIFSQFLFDEHINSRLMKDSRFFTQNNATLKQMYPYERANKFHTGIRTLGLNEEGLSYLDLFRKLITQIGNAMGYIRLIRSGGRRCVADGVRFIPNPDQVDEFTDQLLSETNWSDETRKAAECLVCDIKDLTLNFEEATEYFPLLVNVFAPAFRNPNNTHLKLFYLIMPPLTINYVEHALTFKERLNRNKKNSAITDDGFAMGLAYIMQLLGQESAFNSLHWFQSVQQKFVLESEKIDEQRKNKPDQKLQQALELSEKRLRAFEKEFKLLYYTFDSAKMFFQQ